MKKKKTCSNSTCSAIPEYPEKEETILITLQGHSEEPAQYTVTTPQGDTPPEQNSPQKKQGESAQTE